MLLVGKVSIKLWLFDVFEYGGWTELLWSHAMAHNALGDQWLQNL
jgi:hypothetical protein